MARSALFSLIGLGLTAALGLAALMPAHADQPKRAYAVVERIVYPGQTVDFGNVAIRHHHRDIPDDFPVLRTRAELGGQVALKTILPGRAVPPDAVRPPHTVEAGSALTVSLNEGALSIAMKAVALEDGSIGETIRVRNAQNGRTICATIRSETIAEVC